MVLTLLAWVGGAYVALVVLVAAVILLPPWWRAFRAASESARRGSRWDTRGAAGTVAGGVS